MNTYTKILQILFFIIFISIFSYYNFNEYYKFHKTKIELKEKQIEYNNKVLNFDINKIKKINDIEFYYTPNKELKSKIINYITNAKEYIYIEIYMLTEKKIIEAIIKAHKKWIKVKIILEKDPYKAFNINNKTFNKLKKAEIDIIWSNKNNYYLNHSKVLLIDELSIISTWNLTHSTFEKNRDFFIFTKDKNINLKLKENFLNDYNWIKINTYDNNLIFSPNNSRKIFEKLFKTAKHDIKIYFQYMKDESLVNELIKIKKEKNINITIIIPKTAEKDKEINKLKKSWIKIKIFSKYKMHAKAILIDNKVLYIWSINFSDYSIDKNREIWILIKNIKIIYEFLDIYNYDL